MSDLTSEQQQTAAHAIAKAVADIAAGVRELSDAMGLPALEALAKAKQWALEKRSS